jgi:filamentous hemagglutinin
MIGDEFSDILRRAAQTRGNAAIGSATSAEADALGRAWVGPNYTTDRTGTILISVDRLRQYRPPSFKPSWQSGVYQANFQSRDVPRGYWINNAHLDITDLP